MAADIPFNFRKFLLDGEPVDIEDFIASNSPTFELARILREDLAELQVDYKMYFRFEGSPTEREIYRIS